MRHASGKLSIIYADNRRLFLVVIIDFRKYLVVKYIGDTFIFIVIIDGREDIVAVLILFQL